MRLTLSLALLTFTLFLIGCSAAGAVVNHAQASTRQGGAVPGGDITGDWTSDSPQGKGTFTFKADHTYSENFLDNRNILSDVKGKYQVRANQITLTMTAMNASSADPEERKRVQKLLPQLRTVLNKPMVATLVWNSSDSVTVVIDRGSQLPLVRKK